MKRYIAHMSLATLAGTSLVYLILMSTPLGAQVLRRPVSQSPNAESSWILSRYGQQGRGAGWGRHWHGPGYCPMHDGMYTQNTMETISGRVLSMDWFGAGQGIWLQVETDQEIISVHLGPAWYLDSQEVEIESGDRIDVTGIRRDWNGETIFVASEIKLAGRTIELRTHNRYPL